MDSAATTRENLDGYIRTIAESFWNGDCRLFLGAGFAQGGAQLPSTAKLTSILLKDLATHGVSWLGNLLDGDEVRGNVPLSMAAEYYESMKGRPALVSRIQKELTQFKWNGKSYRMLSSLASKRNDKRLRILHYLYTTNYDTSVEEILHPRATTVTKSNQHILKEETTEGVYVIHLHGVVNGRVDEWVITDRDELREIANQGNGSLLETQLKDDLGKKTLVFIGYSLRDTSMKLLHYLVERSSENSQRDHFIVLRPVDRKESSSALAQAVSNLQAKVMESRRMLLLNLPAEEFLVRLVRRIESLEDEGMINRLAIEFGREPEQIRKLVEEYTQAFDLLSPRAALEILRYTL